MFPSIHYLHLLLLPALRQSDSYSSIFSPAVSCYWSLYSYTYPWSPLFCTPIHIPLVTSIHTHTPRHLYSVLPYTYPWSPLFCTPIHIPLVTSILYSHTHTPGHLYSVLPYTYPWSPLFCTPIHIPLVTSILYSHTHTPGPLYSILPYTYSWSPLFCTPIYTQPCPQATPTFSMMHAEKGEGQTRCHM